MSETENSTTDIDNNVQKKSRATPSKRLSAFEKARLESEALLKSLGGDPESLGSSRRSTRSSARGSAPAPSPATPVAPKPKRKAAATPRTNKKLKLTEAPIDEIDGDVNHKSEENNKDATENVVSESSRVESPVEKVEVDKKESDTAPKSSSEESPVETMEVDETDSEPVIETATGQPPASNEAESKAPSEPVEPQSKPDLQVVQVDPDTTHESNDVDEPILIESPDSQEATDLSCPTPAQVAEPVAQEPEAVVVVQDSEPEPTPESATTPPQQKVDIVEIDDASENEAKTTIESETIIDLDDSNDQSPPLPSSNGNEKAVPTIVVESVGETDSLPLNDVKENIASADETTNIPTTKLLNDVDKVVHEEEEMEKLVAVDDDLELTPAGDANVTSV